MKTMKTMIAAVFLSACTSEPAEIRPDMTADESPLSAHLGSAFPFYQVPIGSGTPQVAIISGLNGSIQFIEPDPPWGYFVQIELDATSYADGDMLYLRLTGSDSGTFTLGQDFRAIPWEQSVVDDLWSLGGSAWYTFMFVDGHMEQLGPRSMLPGP